jgi:uncharacterized membrane protein
LGAVALGLERTIDQDSTFAFRVIVDIAIKALSKAINDPTTAVLAIDQLHRLLRIYYAQSLIYRIYFWIDARRHSSGKRTAHAADHRDDFATR